MEVMQFINKRFNLEIGVSEDIIKSAEHELGVSFADDYRNMLLSYGTISFKGHELTGIGCDKSQNVVYATEKNRQVNENVPLGWYVIEDTHFDNIVFWQSEEGNIYMTSRYSSEPEKVAESFKEYLAKYQVSI